MKKIILGVGLFLAASAFAQNQAYISGSHIQGSAVIQGPNGSISINGYDSNTDVRVQNGSTVIIHGLREPYVEPNRYRQQGTMTIYLNSKTDRFIEIVDTSRNVTCIYDAYQQAVRGCR